MEGKEWKDRKEGKTKGLEKRVNQKEKKKGEISRGRGRRGLRDVG